MAKINVKGDQLIISMEGSRKLWALKSELSIPLDNVTKVTVNPEIWKGTPKFGQKRIGTDLYGFYFAGTFIQDGNKVFYDLKRKEDAVVVTLKDEEFDCLVVGVEDSNTTVELIEKSLNNKNIPKP